MKVRIQMFAGLKDFFPNDFSLEISPGESLGEIRDRLIQEKPESGTLFAQCRAAVGTAFVDYATIPSEGAEISFLPPSSGG